MPAKLFDLDPQRRDAVLNAALKEFSLQGYDNASTNVIAKEAGISKSLMFHYVSSKQELFLIAYDYFAGLMKKEYFELMNYDEKDIFNKLRQSYLLQIKLFEKYPWISELSKLTRVTNSAEINKELENRAHNEHSNCYPKLFDKVDKTKFRKGLAIEKCKQIIFWSNIGFTNQLLEDIRNSDINTLNSEVLIKKIDEYFDELRKLFYTSHHE
ncbi:TetR/AcrR family transcriptional regulator [Sporolactobacillus sp. CPB3-1]|uniref:TetR/AcrR family transcriptional regulator n=1 Tax=Sporolactobacillus mangiferae TaxID=2940498 RepID=A0ABT0MAG5_9BACL|nr:TetR/AcrR family transcriptional regulator [Sporolactobacillus mangiferae]MCL1631330.1 TetR/AcrR family transcriptional regulator [Sporolactobacillus mangiferae]